jgi:hypothetical protein
MLGFNGGTIGIANTVFIGTKSNDPNYSSVSLLLNGNETSGSDPNYSNVSLLLNGNGDNGSTTFTDSSSYGHTVTRVGDAQISTAQNKFGGASMYFDGNGDYLTLPNDQTAFDFGTSDFTIESWIYWPGGVGNIFSQRHAYDNNNTGMTWRTITNYLQFFYGNGLGSFVTPSGSLSTNTWNHIALTRNGNTFTMWINGQSQATNTITASMIYYPPVIGRVQGVNGEYFTGHLDDYRITKGIARYISNFQPPTAQLPDFGNTITDSSSYGHTVTPAGNAQISTTQSKFGGASMYFDGNGDYLTLPASAGFLFPGDHTIECWIYWDGTYVSAGRNIYGTGGSGSLDQFGIFAGAGLYWAGVFNDVSSNYPPINQWTHVAASRQGSTIRLFINGVLTASGTQSASIGSSTGSAYVGNRADLNHPFKGYIDDLRITKGVARYTSNFTPPTAQLPGGETGTFASGLWTSSDHIKQIRNELWPGLIVTDGLVLHLDAGDSASYPGSGTTWTDLSGNGNNGTLTNGPTYDSSDGGSIVFDGDNDYIDLGTIGVSHPLQLNNGFTISWWGIRGIGGDLFQRIIDKSDGGVAANGWSIYPRGQTTPESQLTLNYNGTDGTINSSTNISSTSWQNWSLTWDQPSGNWIWYLNGSADNSGSTTYNIPTVETNARIGTWNHSTAREYKGKFSSFLIYTRPLTPSEITQNYNVLKGRYGL